ncbi:MAG: hypothetical protein FH749_07495 [Firmicutes bacterium]|nr:hypothetical protein [Bacillota bacterium]
MRRINRIAKSYYKAFRVLLKNKDKLTKQSSVKEITTQQAKNFVLTFGGDTNFRDFDDFSHKDFDFLLRDNDYFIVNLEPSFGDKFDRHLRAGRTECLQPFVESLKGLGVTAVSLANESSTTITPEALQITKSYLEQAGVVCLGAGVNKQDASSPLKIKLQGTTSCQNLYILTGLWVSKRDRETTKAVFAAKEAAGVYSLNVEKTVKKVTSLRKEDPEALIIVFPHWQGFEGKKVPSKVKNICNKFITAGANYVIGHGTHYLDYFDVVGDGAIFGSIGDFLRNCSFSSKKRNVLPFSGVVRLEICEKDNGWAIKQKLYPISTGQSKPGNVDYTDAKIVQAHLASAIQAGIKQDGLGYYFSGEAHKDSTPETSEIVPNKLVKAIQQGLQQNVYSSDERYSIYDLLMTEFKKYGYECTMVDKLMTVEINDKQVAFIKTVSSKTSAVASRVLKDKNCARQVFQRAGVNIAKGKLFDSSDFYNAVSYAMTFPACVVKPVNGRKGRAVSVDIRNGVEFYTAWNAASTFSKRGILVEECFDGGMEGRFLVVNGKCIAVYAKVPPAIIGNGNNTIEELIAHKNKLRSSNPHLQRSPIQLSEYRIQFLRKQGYDLDSVPAQGTAVYIDLNSNVSAGGDSFDFTDAVHPSYKTVAELASSSVPGLDIAGVDIIATDFTQKATETNYIVIEANTEPALGGHHYPVYGTPRNAANEIVKYILQSEGIALKSNL